MADTSIGLYDYTYNALNDKRRELERKFKQDFSFDDTIFYLLKNKLYKKEVKS